MKKIIFLNTHPVQYLAPLYAKMTDLGLLVEVWYCSDESIKGGKDQQFGLAVKWDIPLLKGYQYRFFKNYAKWGSIHAGFWGLQNWGVLWHILRAPRSLAVVYGWGYLIQILFILCAKLGGHQVALRCESPLNQELLKSKRSLQLRKLFLKFFIFKLVDHFLYIGQQNKRFYQFYGVADEYLFFAPYSVDNERFQKAAAELLPQKEALKKVLGLPGEAKVILYSGKYIPKKRPLDLLAAYQKLGLANVALVMVGEGELRAEIEKFVREQHLLNVFLTGFVNQSAIVQYYAIADVFVMCSEEGETWGLSTNEAMNFGVPVILSDMVGCAADLVPAELARDHIFALGDVEGLSERVAQCLAQTSKAEWPRQVVDNYSYSQIIDSFKKIVAANQSSTTKRVQG
jgi:glycosyltransferase involved in cell wall biosynthesis